MVPGQRPSPEEQKGTCPQCTCPYQVEHALIRFKQFDKEEPAGMPYAEPLPSLEPAKYKCSMSLAFFKKTKTKCPHPNKKNYHPHSAVIKSSPAYSTQTGIQKARSRFQL
jgi:hypothetical protein